MRTWHPKRRVASRSPKASFQEDSGSHDGLEFNNTIPIDQVEFTGIFGTHQSKSQAENVDLKAWGQSVTTNFFGIHSQKHSMVVKIPIITKDFVKELFLGLLTLHYLTEVCHGLQEKDTQTISAGSRIRGLLGIQTLHSKDPKAARQDNHWKAVDKATTGSPHHYGDRWVPK